MRDRRRAGIMGAAAVLALVGVTVGLSVGLSVALSGSPTAAAEPPSCAGGSPKLTVVGTGVATGTPDLLTVSVGVSVTGPSATGALADDNTTTAAVLAAFTQGGVATKDVQTTGLSVQPDISYAGGNQVVTGYSVDNTVVAKLRDLSKAGDVIDAVAGAAGNATRIDSLNFSVDDPRVIQDRARTDAVRQAVAHAGSMALAAGDHLGPVCSMTDDSTVSPYSLPAGAQSGMRAADGLAAPPVPLTGGSEQADASVTLVYALGSGNVR